MISTTKTARIFATLTASAALSLTALGCGGGAAAGGGAENAASVQHPLLGKDAPDVTAEYVVGDGPKTVKEAKGKVLILDFWGTYCEPCKKAFTKYQEIVDANGGSVAVLAVSVDDADNADKKKLEDFAKAYKAKFAVIWDKDHKAVDAYSLAMLAMPSSFIIDKNGVVKYVHVGFNDGELETINAELKALK
jgi:cytochrome c biogenesis protein CcmG, thiol:disulfide interchange protein DsbE